MIFPANFEQKLGFDQVRMILSDRCLSPLGRQRVAGIGFTANPDEIDAMLSETAEMKEVIQFGEQFPAQDYYDMIPHLVHLRIEATWLEPEQMSELQLSLLTIIRLFQFFGKNSEKYPRLNRHALANAVPSINNHAARIALLIDEKSRIRDGASPALAKIRRERTSKQASVERKVVQSFKLARQSGWTPDDADITIRNGRLVIPLASAHKRRIPGFLHDESATGQTVYIEPAEIFETNNEIRELDYAENREIIRILIEFADSLRPSVDPLIQAYQFLGLIDFLRSKALFALDINGMPVHRVTTAPGPPSGKKEKNGTPRRLAWNNAVHPLLFLSHRKQKKEVVPLDIELNEDNRILIISGPNAGGKSVCLKTAGLVQYMYQCGLLPPVKEDSEFCIFDRIFIDIGDEQSIDNDLSTYTSKLFNLKFFIENTDSRSLFLIDELGGGTDPSLGGAIAEATLEALNARNAFGVVTTHYSNLKLLAGREPGIFNGAMLYDTARLKPLFKLKTGKPGSSFAFEIAREIGFPRQVLESAQQKTGRSQLDFDRELQNLEVEKQEMSKKSTELKVADDFLAELIGKYEKLTADLEKKKKEILETARTEAGELLAGTNRIIEKTIREIRESQAEKSKTKEIREELSAFKDKMMAAEKAVRKEETEAANQSVEAADSKRVKKTPPITKTPAGPYQSYINELQSKLADYRLTLDLRGFRVDEAIPELQRYIDDAILLSISEVKILHGKGNGVLRQVTREYLRTVKEVKSARDEHIEHGGSGITVVNFR
jgi:DNA mismatch repair protein MutS2